VAVAAEFDVPVRNMESERRHRSIVWPRQVAMYIACTITPQSTVVIGRLFGKRDHTTVLHALNKVAPLRDDDSDLDQRIRRLEHHLEQVGPSGADWSDELQLGFLTGPAVRLAPRSRQAAADAEPAAGRMRAAERISAFAGVDIELAELVVRGAQVHHVAVAELRGTMKDEKSTRVRRWVAARARPRWSWWEIGRALNRDHSTVIHHHRRAKPPQPPTTFV
jgi:chromosomal replication initiation ATPase DnaA